MSAVTAFPTEVPLAVGVKPEDGRIVDVGPYRHFVIWAGEDTRSVVSYCNDCGSAFLRQGRLTPEMDPQQRAAQWCGSCHAFMGFIE